MPLTTEQLRKAKRSWTACTAIESPSAMTTAVALWASLWAPMLLAAAEASLKRETV